jgi:oligopeptide transport system substrate-binding protein
MRCLGRSLLAGLVAAALLGSQGAGAAGVLVRGAFGEPESLEPRQSGVASEQTIVRDLFEGLTTFAADGSVVPGAAESWTVSADGLRYTFRLRPGLQWSDGAPLTATDFVRGWQRSLAPGTAAARAMRLYLIRGAAEVHAGRWPADRLAASAPDRRTVVVELAYPSPSLPRLFAGEEGYPLPMHVIDRAGRDWTRAGTLTGNGAFRLVSRQVRGALRLERNPRHHAAATVALDAVVYLPSDDVAMLVNRFRAGEIHVVGWPGFPASRQQALRRELPPGSVRVTPLGSVRYLRFNVAREPFDDLRLREALSLAVDRERLVRSVLPGGELTSVRVAPRGVGAQIATPLVEGTASQRLSRARAALQASGARQRLGRPLRLSVPSGNGEELCLAVAAMWTAAGMPTVTVRSEIRSLIADLRRGDFDVALTGAQEPPALEAYLERFRAGSSYNTGRYAGKEFETLLERALRIADPAARAAAMTTAEQRLAADHPVVPLIQEVARNLVDVRVDGWLDNAEDLHLSRYLRLRPTGTRGSTVK